MDVGVIGVGVMGRNHARLYAELKQVGSLWVTDLNDHAATEVAEANGGEASPSIEDLLGKVDAVSICVPTQYHYDVAATVFEAGVHALIEKPICSSAALAKKLLPLIPKDLTVGVGHIERFNPIVDEIRRMVKRPLYIETNRHNPASARITGTSVVEDLMIHDIDVVFNLFNNGNYRLQSSGTVDACGALCKLNGTTVYMSASRKASKKVRSIYIEEEECTVEGDYMSQEIAVYWKPDKYNIDNHRYMQENIIEKVLVTKQEPLRRELSTFLSCAASKKPFPVTPEQALLDLQVAEKISINLTR